MTRSNSTQSAVKQIRQGSGSVRRTRGEQLAIAVKVCRRVVLEGESHPQVAKSLQIPLNEVGKFLRLAMKSGILRFVEPLIEEDGSESPRAALDSAVGDWTEQKDDRRCHLIDGEIAGTLTSAERSELDALQQEMLDYRRRVAPLPIEAARKLHKALLSELAVKDA